MPGSPQEPQESGITASRTQDRRAMGNILPRCPEKSPHPPSRAGNGSRTELVRGHRFGPCPHSPPRINTSSRKLSGRVQNQHSLPSPSTPASRTIQASFRLWEQICSQTRVPDTRCVCTRQLETLQRKLHPTPQPLGLKGPPSWRNPGRIRTGLC